MRHGYDTQEALTGIVQEVFYAKETAKAQRQMVEPPKTRRMHPHLAAAAKAARRAHAIGLRIATAVDNEEVLVEDLIEGGQQMHQDFMSGQLSMDMIQANEAMGYGKIPVPLSIEQMANYAWAHKQNNQELSSGNIWNLLGPYGSA